MNVAALQKHLHDLSAFLTSAGSSQAIVKDLRAIQAALDPFASEPLSKFAEFLKIAEEYKRTGVLAGKKSSTSKSSGVAPSIHLEVIQHQLHELYEQANTATDSQIDAVLKSLAHKEITLEMLKQLAQAVEAEGKVKSIRAKGKVIDGIRAAILLRRDIAERITQ